MIKSTTPKPGSAPSHGQSQAIRISPDSETVVYFVSCRHMKSDDPAVRRTAIATLIALARHAMAPIRRRARAILEDEFGPFAVSHGLPGCAAPMSEVQRCYDEDRGCRGCAWVWYNEALCAPPAC